MSLVEEKKQKQTRAAKNDNISASYNKFKKIEGKQYTGMSRGSTIMV